MNSKDVYNNIESIIPNELFQYYDILYEEENCTFQEFCDVYIDEFCTIAKEGLSKLKNELWPLSRNMVRQKKRWLTNKHYKKAMDNIKSMYDNNQPNIYSSEYKLVTFEQFTKYINEKQTLIRLITSNERLCSIIL